MSNFYFALAQNFTIFINLNCNDSVIVDRFDVGSPDDVEVIVVQNVLARFGLTVHEVRVGAAAVLQEGSGCGL